MSFQRYTGSAWTDISKVQRYTGSAWTDCEAVKRYNGSAWVDVWQNKHWLFKEGTGYMNELSGLKFSPWTSGTVTNTANSIVAANTTETDDEGEVGSFNILVNTSSSKQFDTSGLLEYSKMYVDMSLVRTDNISGTVFSSSAKIYLAVMFRTSSSGSVIGGEPKLVSTTPIQRTDTYGATEIRQVLEFDTSTLESGTRFLRVGLQAGNSTGFANHPTCVSDVSGMTYELRIYNMWFK